MTLNQKALLINLPIVGFTLGLWVASMCGHAKADETDHVRVEGWSEAFTELGACHSLDEPLITGLCRDGQRIEILLGAHGEVYWRKVQPIKEERQDK